MIRTQRLLRRRDEILLGPIPRHFIQLLVEVVQLRALCHRVLLHEVRGLHRREPLLDHRLGAELRERQGKQNARAGEEVAAVSGHGDAALVLDAADHVEEVDVVHRRGAGGEKTRGGGVDVAPLALDAVVVLIIRDRDIVVHNISDFAELGIALGFRDLRFLLDARDFLLQLRDLRPEVSDVLLRLHQPPKLFAHRVHLRAQPVALEAQLPGVLIECDDGVDDGGVAVAAALRLANFLRVAALLDAEKVDLKHGAGG
mmetsp:Transcript_5744/g.13903  ORF Transcript_5744/g.13903 Transcript_5744/m.13903 type:complete len:257 (+) Transcript_5744:2331-3101(+)